MAYWWLLCLLYFFGHFCYRKKEQKELQTRVKISSTQCSHDILTNYTFQMTLAITDSVIFSGPCKLTILFLGWWHFGLIFKLHQSQKLVWRLCSFSIETILNLEVSVEYFDQRLGADHSKHWSKFYFQHFLC